MLTSNPQLFQQRSPHTLNLLVAAELIRKKAPCHYQRRARAFLRNIDDSLIADDEHFKDFRVFLRVNYCLPSPQSLMASRLSPHIPNLKKRTRKAHKKMIKRLDK